MSSVRSSVMAQETAKLYALRDEFAVKVAQFVKPDAPSLEWARLSREHRIIFLMLAGIDGEVEAIALQDWQEFTPPEQVAIQVMIRGMMRALDGVAALVRK